MNANVRAYDFSEEWVALCRLAVPNVFMSPAAVRAVRVAGFSPIKVIPAWLNGKAPLQLVGLWALQQSRLTPLGPSYLSAPPYNYAFLSNPVLDPQHLDLAMTLILDAIELDERLPKVLRLRYLDADSPSYGALTRALHARGAKMVVVSEHQRPVATKAEGQKASGSTRKKLKNKWNRLTNLGEVAIQNDPSPEAVQEAFEVFLEMEHASWKGSAGTSLLSDARDAAFVRKLICELARDGSASVALLTLDSRAIAAQVLFKCGTVAYTWKTAFNAEFDRVSPGALLIYKVTDMLFDSGITESIESCSPEGSYLNQLWPERRSTVEVVAHLSSKQAINYTAVSAGARCYAQLRQLRDKLREMKRSRLKGRGEIAASNR